MAPDLAGVNARESRHLPLNSQGVVNGCAPQVHNTRPPETPRVVQGFPTGSGETIRTAGGPAPDRDPDPAPDRAPDRDRARDPDLDLDPERVEQEGRKGGRILRHPPWFAAPRAFSGRLRVGDRDSS